MVGRGGGRWNRAMPFRGPPPQRAAASAAGDAPRSMPPLDMATRSKIEMLCEMGFERDQAHQALIDCNGMLLWWVMATDLFPL